MGSYLTDFETHAEEQQQRAQNEDGYEKLTIINLITYSSALLFGYLGDEIHLFKNSMLLWGVPLFGLNW